MVRLQSGSNQFASQRGMALGSSRDVAGKHLHRIWDGLYDDEIAEERATAERGQIQHQTIVVGNGVPTDVQE